MFYDNMGTKISDLGLEDVGVKVDKGRILVDEYMQTNIKFIYVAVDVIPGKQLTHLASFEWECAVENILGQRCKMEYWIRKLRERVNRRGTNKQRL